MTTTVETRRISILCSLDSHEVCVEREPGTSCSCGCHYQIVVRRGDTDFEAQLTWLAFELWKSSNVVRLTWKQTRQIVLKFLKVWQTPHPIDDEVDETTDVIYANRAKDYWSQREWLEAYAARKVVSPTLF